MLSLSLSLSLSCSYYRANIIQTEYTELGGDEELPLGEEFQSLVKVFITPSEKKPEKRYEWAAKLIEQL